MVSAVFTSCVSCPLRASGFSENGECWNVANLFVHSFIPSFIHSLIHSCIYSFIHLHTRFSSLESRVGSRPRRTRNSSRFQQSLKVQSEVGDNSFNVASWGLNSNEKGTKNANNNIYKLKYTARWHKKTDKAFVKKFCICKDEDAIQVNLDWHPTLILIIFQPYMSPFLLSKNFLSCWIQLWQ